MVAEPREEYRSRDTRKEEGVAARFRALGGDGPERPEPPSVPVFGTAPWGYKRAEVDAWMSWVSGLVEHGRRESLRADSAEATLKATLDQLEQLHSLETSGVLPDEGSRTPPSPARAATSGWPNGARVSGPLPRRVARPVESLDSPTDEPAETAGPRPATPSDPAGPRSAVPPEPAGPRPGAAAAEPDDPGSGSAHAGPPADAPPGQAPERREPVTPDRDPDRPELARLQVVETTLHEVMGLLNRLVESGRGTDRPRDDGR